MERDVWLRLELAPSEVLLVLLLLGDICALLTVEESTEEQDEGAGDIMVGSWRSTGTICEPALTTPGPNTGLVIGVYPTLGWGTTQRGGGRFGPACGTEYRGGICLGNVEYAEEFG